MYINTNVQANECPNQLTCRTVVAVTRHVQHACMICRRGVDAKDAAECSREVAGILAKFADAGGKSDTDR